MYILVGKLPKAVLINPMYYIFGWIQNNPDPPGKL